MALEMTNFQIRLAVKNDCNSLLSLIQEYCKNRDGFQSSKLTRQSLEEDGFGNRQYYKCFMAEVPKDASQEEMTVVGYALYHNIYSTWEGKSLKLETIYVSPKYRHMEIAKSLLKAVSKEGLKNGCSLIDCCVSQDDGFLLDFARENGATDLTTTKDYHLFQLSKRAMENFFIKSNQM